MFSFKISLKASKIFSSKYLFRLAGRSEVNSEGFGAFDADRLVGHVRHSHLRHHRTRVLLGSSPQNLLLNFKPQ